MSTWPTESSIVDLRHILGTLEQMLTKLDMLKEQQVALSLNVVIEQLYARLGEERPPVDVAILQDRVMEALSPVTHRDMTQPADPE
jgi:hypothetical protein